jgi:O-antigen/teichoic acid export membrane protein
MRRRLLGGLFWQGGTTLLARGTRYIAVLILGGLLSSADFGVFASLYVFVEGLFLFQGMGLGEALIVRRERIDEAVDTTFVLAAILGFVFFGIAWLAAPLIGSFYGMPESVAPFRVLATVLIVHRAAGRTAQAWKGLQLPCEARPHVDGIRDVLGGLRCPGFARARRVVVRLGRRGIGGGGALLFWLAWTWRPRWRLDTVLARSSAGGPVVTGALLTYLFGTVDRVSLARFGGAELLGPYAFAYSLAALPTTINAASGHSAVASYSALAEDRGRRLALHLRAVSWIASAGVLFALVVVSFGGDALRAAYGPKWNAAVPLLRILAVGAVFRSLGALVGDLLVGIGRPDAYQKMNALKLVAAIVGLPLGLVKGGADGVAVVVSVASAVALVYGWTVARAPLGTSFAPLLASLATPLRAGLAGSAAVVLIRLTGLRLEGPATVIAAAGLVSAVFVATCWIVDSQLRSDVRSVLAARAS